MGAAWILADAGKLLAKGEMFGQNIPLAVDRLGNPCPRPWVKRVHNVCAIGAVFRVARSDPSKYESDRDTIKALVLLDLAANQLHKMTLSMAADRCTLPEILEIYRRAWVRARLDEAADLKEEAA